MHEEDRMSETELLQEPVGEDDWSAAMTEQGAAAETAPAVEAQAQPARIFPQFADDSPKAEHLQDFDLILDIPVQISVELGRTRIAIRDLLQLAHGSVVELNAAAGEALDVLVNGTLIAQGEVVVVNEKFGIRLTDIVTPSERMKKLNR